MKLLIYIFMFLPVFRSTHFPRHLHNDCLGLAYFSAHGEVLFWHSFSCPQAAPYELSLDVNKMFRRSVRPRGVLSALGHLPGEDRGSSGRIMTLTGPSSSLRNHMLRQQQWSKSANQQLAFLVLSTVAILNPMFVDTSNFVQIFLCAAYLVYCFMVSEIGNGVSVSLPGLASNDRIIISNEHLAYNGYSAWGMTTLTEGFPCFFLSCKANARVKPAKTGHGPYTS
jgi:hypothetical protein